MGIYEYNDYSSNRNIYEETLESLNRLMNIVKGIEKRNRKGLSN